MKYIKLIRRFVKESVELYATENQLSIDSVLPQVRNYINAFSNEYKKDKPQIQYDDPLCQIAYVYKYVMANATMFERVLIGPGGLATKVTAAQESVLNICSLGGGPGTELMGVARYLLDRPDRSPARISFTTMDSVFQWKDPGQRIADLIGNELYSSWGDIYPQPPTQPPTISWEFDTFDLFDVCPSESSTSRLAKADIIVLNYVLSENKNRLNQLAHVVNQLAQITSSGCVFAVIDQMDYQKQFKRDIAQLFESVFDAKKVNVTDFDGVLDGKNQTSEMGECFITALGLPRVKLTAFWFVVKHK